MVRARMWVAMSVVAVSAVGFAAVGSDGDAGKERAARGEKLLAGVTFSHPREITNPYLPLGTLKQDVLEGTEGKAKVHIERTASEHGGAVGGEVSG
ncbi:MAG TPA: hypothetical protein VM008_09705, partial [Phycisphaerae bacterium]|nr:hypothetical protein [Phycisphaerae bacterium]